MVKSESRRVLKRFLTVTINSGTENEFLYPLSVYEHSGDITNVCFDQIVDHEKITFPDIYTIENDTDINSIRFFNRDARIAIIHSQSTYNEELVKKTMKYWGWIYVTKDVLANPYDDILLGYIDEMCKTFSDNSKFDDKLDKVGNISIGEDNSDLLTINSTINIPGGTTGQSLVKGSDGNITYSTVSGGGGSSLTIKNAGTSLTNAATSIDFTGAGVTASGTSDGNKTVNIPGSSLTIKNAGTSLTNDATSIDFTGAGVTASGTSDGNKTVNIPGSSLTIKNAGTSLTNDATSIDFTGAGVTASGTSDGNKTVNIPGSSLTLQNAGSTLSTNTTVMNFTGAGVTASGDTATKTIDIPGVPFAINDTSISPDDVGNNRIQVNFTSFNNNGNLPYADAIHFNTWSDNTGGNQNLLMLNKTSIGLRIYQGAFGSSSAYSTYKDVVLADSNGNVGIGISSPSTPLHVNGNITCTTLVGNCSGTSTSINLTEDASTNTNFIIPFTDGTSGSRALKGHSSFNYNPSTSTLTVPNINANISVNTVNMVDNRQILPSELTGGKVQFNFTTFNNNSNYPFADAIHLNTYTDSSGGSQNLIVLNKSTGIDMRIYQGTFGDTNAYSTYKDVVLADSSGNIDINGGLDIGGDINITTALATGTSDQRETILKVRLPFTSGLKEECFGSIGFKDFINNGTGAKPTFELKLGTLTYTNIALTAVSHSNDDSRIGIGVTSPRTGLHLKYTGNTGDDSELVIESGSNKQSIITLCEDPAGNFGFDIQYDGSSTANSGSISNMFYIRTINSGTKAISLASKRSNGFIGILDDNPSTALDVNGTVTCTGFNNTSDDRIKYNEVNIDTSIALNVINQLTPQKYEKIIEKPQNLSGTWIPTDTEWEIEKNETITQTNEDGSTTILPKWNYHNETGLVAQDVKNINELSDCVIGDEVDSNGNQTPLKLNYNDIFSYHIAATKELTTQLNTANQKIATLESEIAAIKEHLGI